MVEKAGRISESAIRNDLVQLRSEMSLTTGYKAMCNTVLCNTELACMCTEGLVSRSLLVPVKAHG